MQEYVDNSLTLDGLLLNTTQNTIGGIGKTLTIGGAEYKVTGIINVGEIPAEYAVLVDGQTVDERLTAQFMSYLNDSMNQMAFVSEARLKTIETNKERLESEIRILEEKQEKESRNAEEVYKAKEEAEKEMEHTSRMLQDKIRQHAALAEAMSQSTEQTDQYKDEMFRLQSEITSHKAEINSLKNLQETLQNRRQQILDEKSGSEDESRDTLDAMSRIRTERQELDEEFKQSSSDLENQRAHMEDMMKEERILAKNLEELRISIGQLSARKKTIEEMESNYEGYNYAVKFIMRSGLPGIFGTVAELITVPEGYEVAIETAMGAALQNIVCQDDRSAQNAIVKLKENKAGRLTFLPVSSIKGYSNSYAGKLEHEAGFKGFGVDCIEFDSKYTSVMEYLIGRVVIVDTMENAVRLSKKANGLRFVTLEGEIINAGGAITGGRYKNKTANLLERKAEINELAQKLESDQRQRDADAARVVKLQDEIARLREKNVVDSQEVRRLEMKLLEKDNEMRMTEKLLADFKENSGKWDKELENIQVQQDNSQNMIRQLEDKVTAKEAEVKAAEAKAVEQLDEYDSIKTQAEALSEEITAARIAATSSENKKNNAEQMAERIKAALDEIKNDCDDKKGQLTNLDIEQKYLESEADTMGAKLNAKEEEKENLNRYLSELTEERTATGHEMVKLNAEKEALDKEVISFQNRKYEMEIKVAKNETQLDSFKDKLWEDFELSYIQAMEFKKEEFNVALAAKENRQLRSRMKALGDVNIGAIAEYEKENERYEFLSGQRADILEATESLKQIIEDMDKTIKAKFKESFDQVVVHFEEIFKQLFGGGHAELRLDDENNPLEAGIDIIAQPPGKKLQNINLLSGGEKTMTAIALMFAVLKTKPTPFCILDEVEAALDDANIERFAKYLKTFDDIQFTLVTHQKATMEHADVLYGVTMPEQGISKVLSLNMGDSFEI